MCNYIFSCSINYINDTYFNTRDFVIDYLRFQASDYVKDEKDNTVINREDNSCHILLSSKITKSNDLSNLGALEKINNHEWVKQEFENGETWMSYYKNSFYIVQMYGADKKIYENSCKDDFEKIKKTFSFIKSE